MEKAFPCALSLILDRLEGVRPSGTSGRQFTARCPAHDDHRASLSIGLAKDRRRLLHCHAGCRTEDVVRALELDMGDLFPKVADVYDYCDEDDHLLFQVVRFDPKDFRQRRPDRRGGFIWNLDGVSPVLYRLPDVLDGIRAGETIFIVEGEKDVHALERRGKVATTCPGGAGKWRPAYTAALKGARRVVVIADRDEPGRRHARAVVAALRAAGL